MTEHDKLALLNLINSMSESLQYIIAAEEKDDSIDLSKLKLCYQGIIHDSIEMAESEGCKVIWKDNKAVKIVEKRDKKSEKNIKKNIWFSLLWASLDIWIINYIYCILDFICYSINIARIYQIFIWKSWRINFAYKHFCICIIIIIKVKKEYKKNGINR